MNLPQQRETPRNETMSQQQHPPQVAVVKMYKAREEIYPREISGRFASLRWACVWLTQLVFNATWSWLFFGRHLLAAALVEIVVLLALIVATTVAFFRRDRAAGWLMVPYIAWVSFATVLNAALWQLNPAA